MTTVSICNVLEVGGVGIAPQNPALGSVLAPESLIIGVDHRQLVLKVIADDPLVWGQARGVGSKVKVLDEFEEPPFPLTEIAAQVGP